MSEGPNVSSNAAGGAVLTPQPDGAGSVGPAGAGNHDSPLPKDALRTEVIDNEFPAYRAVHPLAIIAAVCGMVSVLAFVHSFFYLVAGAAVLFGFVSQRSIRRLSDVYTGEKLAQFGIAMGLVCSLTSMTNSRVQDLLIAREAKKFSEAYVQLLADPNAMEDLLYYRVQPAARKNTSPEQLMAKFKSSQGDPGAFNEMIQPIQQIQNRLKATSPKSLIVEAVEQVDREGLLPVATVRLALLAHDVHDDHEGHSHETAPAPAPALVTTPPADPKKAADPKAAPPAPAPAKIADLDKDAYALLLLKADASGGKYEWWVDKVIYPYNVKQKFQYETKVDTHGHDHGDGGSH